MASSGPDLSGKTVLIVADEDGIREIIMLELEMHGCRVLQASGGAHAFEMVQHERIDVVLTDVRMPAGGGLEFLERVGKLKSGRPAVFLMTGYSDIKATEAKARGAVAMFQKPFPLKDVIDAVKNHLVSPPA